MVLIQENIHPDMQIKPLLLEHAVQLTLDVLNQPDVDITLRLTDDDELYELNRTYRGIAKPTDVLSFNQDTVDPETGRLYLGDIIISVDRAIQQAEEQGHSTDQEVAFLAIHGTLHLLGYDHAEADEKQRMWSLQDEIFDQLVQEAEGDV